MADDKLGNAYEYLIKEFADDSGHTAAEFYTNRTVVKLMTKIMDPQPGESVYDPTCGSGGLLLNCALHLKDEGKEYRNLKLYGQEINLITSAIARMNMFMHGIEEFKIVRGDTLAEPGLLENDQLKTFNVILANPPYSIKSWNRDAFVNDPWGRNIWGLPPQGCADYAFQQHIQKSLDTNNGRFAILWPHGILFRDAEAAMRRNMIKDDVIEAVIGVGPNLFYNSPMEAMILVGNNNKPADRKGKILFVDGKNDVVQNKGQAHLTNENIEKLYQSFVAFENVEGYSKVVTNEEILEKFSGNLNISFYVKTESVNNENLGEIYTDWLTKSESLKTNIEKLLNGN